MQPELKQHKRRMRHFRSRKKMVGTEDRPRLSVYRSHIHLYAQAVDDVAEQTVCASSTLDPSLRKKKRKQWGNIEAAKEFGILMADTLKKKKIKRIVFDRGGRPFQGRLRAFADAVREQGIEF